MQNEEILSIIGRAYEDTAILMESLRKLKGTLRQQHDMTYEGSCGRVFAQDGHSGWTDSLS